MFENYKVLTGGGKNATEAAKQISERVNHAIAEGWKPIGGLIPVPDVAGPNERFVEFAQAMAMHI